jgi:hypothetical protein
MLLHAMHGERVNTVNRVSSWTGISGLLVDSMRRPRGRRRSELATSTSTNRVSTHRSPRVLWYPSCPRAGPYYPLYPGYQGPRPLLHLCRARNLTLYLTQRSCQFALRTVPQLQRPCLLLHRCRACVKLRGYIATGPCPSRLKPGMLTAYLAYIRVRRSTVAVGAAPSCLRPEPGFLSVAS